MPYYSLDYKNCLYQCSQTLYCVGVQIDYTNQNCLCYGFLAQNFFAPFPLSDVFLKMGYLAALRLS